MANKWPHKVLLVELHYDGSTRVRIWYVNDEIVAAVAESLGDCPDSDVSETAEDISRGRTSD